MKGNLILIFYWIIIIIIILLLLNKDAFLGFFFLFVPKNTQVATQY